MEIQSNLKEKIKGRPKTRHPFTASRNKRLDNQQFDVEIVLVQHITILLKKSSTIIICFNREGKRMIFSKILFVAAVALVSASAAFQNCPYLGPDFPKPTYLTHSGTLQRAFTNLTSSLSRATNTGKTSYGTLNASTNSFSLQVFSVQDPVALFQSHHTATNLASLNSSGVEVVDANTVYRIGSLTKLLTIYTFLVQVGDQHFSQPVTNYVPELANVMTNVPGDVLNDVVWSDITLGDLASHLGGIGRDSKFLLSDLLNCRQ